MHPLEEQLGHHFGNRKLLEQALTHRSFAQRDYFSAGDYERLEFLGDAVLEEKMSTLLFSTYPDADPGELTTRRAALVSDASLARFGKRMKLKAHIRVAPDHTISDQDLADVVEALFGALFLEGAHDILQSLTDAIFVFGEGKSPRNFEKSAKEVSEKSPEKKHPVSLLYEWWQREKVEENLVFDAEGLADGRVRGRWLLGNNVLGKAKAKTKKAARLAAAEDAIKHWERSF